MEIFLNGEHRDVTNGITISRLLVQLDMQGRRVAVEVNEEIIPRSEHDGHHLQAGDRVEVVQAIGGG